MAFVQGHFRLEIFHNFHAAPISERVHVTPKQTPFDRVVQTCHAKHPLEKDVCNPQANFPFRRGRTLLMCKYHFRRGHMNWET